MFPLYLPFLLRLFPILTCSLAGFFGRKVMVMLSGKFGILFVIVFFCLIFLLRHSRTNSGLGLRLYIYNITFCFAISLIRISVFSHIGLDLTTFFPLVLSVGGGGVSDAGPSVRSFDLNEAPSPEPPSPPTALAEETSAALKTKREKVKNELFFLLQIGYQGRARPYMVAKKIVDSFDLDQEGDENLLDQFYERVYDVSATLGGSDGRPAKLDEKGLKALTRWVKERRE